MPSSCCQRPTAVLLMVAMNDGHQHVVMHTHCAHRPRMQYGHALAMRTNPRVLDRQSHTSYKHTPAHVSTGSHYTRHQSSFACTTIPCTHWCQHSAPYLARRRSALTSLMPQVGCFAPPQNESLATPAAAPPPYATAYRCMKAEELPLLIRKCSRLSPALSRPTRSIQLR